MVLKAGLIVAVFMHMAWERLALAYALLLPPVLVLVFVTIMVLESDYTHLLRLVFFAPTAQLPLPRTRKRDGYDHLRHASKLDRAGILKAKESPRRLDSAKKTSKDMSSEFKPN
jgi:hypothetical protein